MNISLITDLVCPYCYIGFAQLQKALGQRPEMEFTIGSLPFQIDPAIPEEGVIFNQYIAERFGSNAKQMLDDVTLMGDSEGLDIRFDKITTWPNTMKAHRLLALCPGDKRLDLYEALFKAVFTEGKNIGDDAVLFEIAKTVGFDASQDLHSEELITETKRMMNATLAMGVTGVPVFIFEDKNSIAGVQSTEAILFRIDTTEPAEPV